MGQRANVVVIEAGRRSLYYDRWAANRLEVELAWGPALGLAFARSLRPVSEPDGWLDDVWCEGAALIDADARDLLFFGGEDVLHDLPLRRACLQVLGETWPGWRVRWAQEGIHSLADHLGLPRAAFASQSQGQGGGVVRRNDEFPEDDEMLLTRVAGGRLDVTRASGSWEELLGGPKALVHVLERDLRPLTRWTGEFPTIGVHLDVDARAASVWWASDDPGIGRRLRSAWSGWELRPLEDRYDEQLALVEGRVEGLRVDPDAQRARFLDHLERLVHHEGQNPAARTLVAMGGGELNPWTEAAAGSAGDPGSKRAILERLRRPGTFTR